MIDAVVLRMYTEEEENRFLEVTYAGGDKEILYFKDFNSGAMIQNIVDRSKKMAIKDFLDTGQRGLRVEHLLQSCTDEFRENEDLPEHDQPRRLGAHLRQEGGADRLHPHPHQDQGGHRAGQVDQHGRQHRPVPLTRPAAPAGQDGAMKLGLQVNRSPGRTPPRPPVRRGGRWPATPTSAGSPRCG